MCVTSKTGCSLKKMPIHPNTSQQKKMCTSFANIFSIMTKSNGSDQNQKQDILLCQIQ